MATKDQVIALALQNPTWTAADIAASLNCLPEYVRKTAHRQNIRITRRSPRDPNTVTALGRKARLLGLTAEDLERAAAAKVTSTAKMPRAPGEGILGQKGILG